MFISHPITGTRSHNPPMRMSRRESHDCKGNRTAFQNERGCLRSMGVEDCSLLVPRIRGPSLCVSITGSGATACSEKINSNPLENRYQTKEKDHGKDTVSGKCHTESPAVPQHPGKNQKHWKSRQDKPESPLSVIGDTTGILTFHPHPDHGQQ